MIRVVILIMMVVMVMMLMVEDNRIKIIMVQVTMEIVVYALTVRLVDGLEVRSKLRMHEERIYSTNSFSRVMFIFKEDGETNLSDVLTKALGKVKRVFMRSRIISDEKVKILKEKETWFKL